MIFTYEFLKNNGVLRDAGGPGSEARLGVLLCLVGHANRALRAYPTVSTIMTETGFTNKNAVCESLAWLASAGAIYNVPPEHRQGKEKSIRKDRNVYQLTGVMEIAGKAMWYLYLSDETRADVVDELRSLGADHALSLMECEEESGTATAPISAQSGTQTVPVAQSGTLTVPQSGTVTDTQTYSSKDNKPNIVGGAADAVPEDPFDTMSADELLALQGEKPGKAEVASAVDHPFIQLILSATGQKSLNKKQATKLTTPFSYQSEAGPVRSARSLLQHYDDTPGFADFARERLAAWVAWKKVLTAEESLNFLAHLQNFDSQGKMGGWNRWRAGNPLVTTSQATPEAPKQDTSEEETRRAVATADALADMIF